MPYRECNLYSALEHIIKYLSSYFCATPYANAYLEFTVSQEMEFFLACHENAFAAFGSVPARLMVDLPEVRRAQASGRRGTSLQPQVP